MLGQQVDEQGNPTGQPEPRVRRRPTPQPDGGGIFSTSPTSGAPEQQPGGTRYTPREGGASSGNMPSIESRMGMTMPSPTMSRYPNPIAGQSPVPNPLPTPDPHALTSGMFGGAGGYLEGGLGVPGAASNQGKPESSDLLAMLASLLGSR